MAINFQAKRCGLKHPTRGAGSIVEDTLRKELKKMDEPTDVLIPQLHNIKRAVNRTRQAMRPPHPLTHDFTVNIFLTTTNSSIRNLTNGFF